jgi:predicted nucleic acid-binding protein
MSTPAPYGGRRLIADTSVWTALERARKLGNTPPDWIAAVEADQILTHPVVMLELLHSARNNDEFLHLRERFERLRLIQLTQTACQSAIDALGQLAAKSDCYHRVDLGDALVAASAADVNPAVGVLHYNHKDFEKLAEVLSFDAVAFGAPGEFEAAAT